ncbi:MFS transporter [Allokutzneria albata]|uniref:Major Facilitator Superfamily protein n=1 Tax=Allokutzneria albata TaxID=211114 RepID=A0A1G9SSA8_ALLAB|nr:MFS transporter [Allokutzneria albata]SDM38300.1 Major Facilitator Superfamily protein [Allokutzneria albata]
MGHMTLALLSLAQFLIALDYSIIFIALPSIAGELALAPATAQWIVSAYAVLFAGFLVVGGRLTDRVGAKPLFILAIAGFGVASAAGGLAEDGGVLLAARAAQGLGAALLQPAVLGLIGTTFPAGPARSRALVVWGSVGASGLAAGAILGGLLTVVSWRLTFMINVPLTLLCAAGALAWFAPATDRSTQRIPVGASVLGTGAVLSLVLGLTLAAEQGWGSTLTVISLGLGVVLLAAFIRNERTARAVLIEPVLRRTSSLRAGALATALYMASVGAEFYLLTLLLQKMKGYTPLEAGLAFLPLAIMVTAGNTAAGRAAQRFGARAALVAGFALAAIGLLWISLALQGDSYVLHLLPGILLSGFGHGVIYTSMFTIGTGDVPAAHQGTAGALLTTSQYLSGAMTVAVLTLALGASPGHGNFQVAFLITAAAAAGGVVLGLRPLTKRVFT